MKFQKYKKIISSFKVFKKMFIFTVFMLLNYSEFFFHLLSKTNIIIKFCKKNNKKNLQLLVKEKFNNN